MLQVDGAVHLGELLSCILNVLHLAIRFSNEECEEVVGASDNLNKELFEMMLQ